MKTLIATLFLTLSSLATAAAADSRIFIVANHSDGYGVDKCLASGQSCGAAAARSYCQSHHYAAATEFRRVDADDITGSVSSNGTSLCSNGICREYVAITCQR